METPIPTDVTIPGLEGAGPAAAETTSSDPTLFNELLTEAAEGVFPGDADGVGEHGSQEFLLDGQDPLLLDEAVASDPANELPVVTEAASRLPGPATGMTVTGLQATDTASEPAVTSQRPDVPSGVKTNAPVIVTTSGGNPFVGQGEGQALTDLDLEGHDVRRIEIHADADPEPPVRVSDPTRVRIEPGMLLNRGPAPAVTDSLAQPNTGPNQVLDIEVPAEDLVPREVPQTRVAEAVSSLPIFTSPRTSRGAGAVDTNVAAADTRAGAGVASDDTVQWISEVPREMGDSGRPADSRTFVPPQPVKPVVLPTFTLDPVRRVIMQVGESGNEVQVQIRENQGDVSIRLSALNPVRGGLEASVQNLVDSLNRQQVSLSDLSFSDPSDGQAGSGESQHGDSSRPSHRNASIPDPVEDSLSTPEFETGTTGSLIRLVA